ncbi:flagellar protein FlaG [Methylomonas sp. SURF-1]|uniref:Flagellar protein FlaG n=1 Tax=Methylomonas aurea TaxID=2952224 RepID=A0ABT1UIL8_9GAMM|nr:flagellar protein FlaG [Methylomonas sp. SURF-1]MCQ8182084.1 flagellar protein FlaG [Methylomonas sp. SURF-1]
MNSEITNVLKLVPVTTVKTDKQETGKVPPQTTKAATDRGDSNVAALSQDKQSVTNALSGTEKKDKADQKPPLEVVRQAAKEGNSILQATQRNLQFKVDDDTKEVVVKIVDSESGELVRQIPSEEMLAFIRRMQELQGDQGSVIQDRA